MMATVTRKRYTKEFKAQAVGLVGIGKPVKDVARDLGISEGVLYEWVRKGSQARNSGAKDCEPKASNLEDTLPT
jgi:transposase-like protein